MKLRTVLLCALVLQLCLLYTVIYEACVSLKLNDFATLAGTDDIRLFYKMLAIVGVASSLLIFMLIISAMKAYSRCQKSFLVLVTAFHITICLPFYATGFYLYNKSLGNLDFDVKSAADFDAVISYTSSNGTQNSTSEVVESAIRVSEIQARYCCCGKDSPQDYKGNKTVFAHNSTTLVGGFTLNCPSNFFHKNFHCVQQNFEGCSTRSVRIQATEIVVYTSIGFGCAICMLIISPFLYAEFEYDRRRARAAHIRNWRRQIDSKLAEDVGFQFSTSKDVDVGSATPTKTTPSNSERTGTATATTSTLRSNA